MAKPTSVWTCSACGNEISRWMGKCPRCEAFNTLVESTKAEPGKSAAGAGLKTTGAVTPVKKALTIKELNRNPIQRTPSGIGELDRVLGGGFVDSEVVLFAGAPGAGKALAGSTPIPTPDGFVSMKDLSVGDTVFDGKGKPTLVAAKFYPSVTEAYKITFSNGQAIEACADHLWEVTDLERSRHRLNGMNRRALKDVDSKHIWEALNELAETNNDGWLSLPALTNVVEEYTSYSKRTSLQSVKSTAAALKLKSKRIDGMVYYHVAVVDKLKERSNQDPQRSYPHRLVTRVVSTKELYELGAMSHGKRQWRIQAVTTETPAINLPFDPYTLGLWLGDGSSKGARLGGATEDMLVYCTMSEELSEEKLSFTGGGKYAYLTIGNKRNKFLSFLKTYDLYGNKHIPEIYLQAGTEQRRELLRGIMDTDGYADNGGRNGVGVGFSDRKLLDDTRKLVASLGSATVVHNKQPMKDGAPYGKMSYSINFQANFDCFHLPRKSSRCLKPFGETKSFFYLDKIAPTNVEEEYYCIMVESETHTFLASETYIPTHNSTLSLSIAANFAARGHVVLYSSGEESESQIGLRAQRMGVDDDRIRIINEVNLETLMGQIQVEKPKLLIVDSLQTLASTEIAGSIGSISQSKEAAHTLTRIAKTQGITMLLINQIIKSGEFAGSEAVQHIVDCSLILESDSDTPLKFLRATKNRFGDTTEVGVFQHSELGLEEVADPSGILIEEEGRLAPGTACSFLSEGMRQIPMEVQALVSRSDLPNPRKQFSGVNFQRGQIVCAILDKFCATKLYEKDVFLSTVSGLKVNDPQSDLAVAAALLSSAKEKQFPGRTLFIGELSLTGFVRGSFMVEQKLREAERLGFERVVIPKTALKGLSSHKFKIKVEAITSVKELAAFL